MAKNSIAGALGQFFSAPAKQRRKPGRYLITWPTGKTEVVVREGRFWVWTDRGAKAESSHLDNLRHQVEAQGGTLSRIKAEG